VVSGVAWPSTRTPGKPITKRRFMRASTAGPCRNLVPPGGLNVERVRTSLRGDACPHAADMISACAFPVQLSTTPGVFAFCSARPANRTSRLTRDLGVKVRASRSRHHSLVGFQTEGHCDSQAKLSQCMGGRDSNIARATGRVDHQAATSREWNPDRNTQD